MKIAAYFVIALLLAAATARGGVAQFIGAFGVSLFFIAGIGEAASWIFRKIGAR